MFLDFSRTDSPALSSDNEMHTTISNLSNLTNLSTDPLSDFETRTMYGNWATPKHFVVYDKTNFLATRSPIIVYDETNNTLFYTLFGQPLIEAAYLLNEPDYDASRPRSKWLSVFDMEMLIQRVMYL